jgi:pre-mRNA-splicing factor ATP-dependent RNA helicase DHX15/PRP43
MKRDREVDDVYAAPPLPPPPPPPGAELNPLTRQPYSAQHAALLQTRRRLPVWQHRAAVLRAAVGNPVTLLVGETGSGKSTQIPQFIALHLADHPLGAAGAAGAVASPLLKPPVQKVACTQPRRVAAMSIAQRVAAEADVALGGAVGYCVRFDERRRDDTAIVFLTDGMLLREAVSDPLLAAYSVVLVDEAHERTVQTDLLLGLLKGILAKRTGTAAPLHIVVMSATLDVAKFQAFFEGAPVVTVPGRTFSVDKQYVASAAPEMVDAAVAAVLRIHRAEPLGGDVLVFLTGERDIRRACAALASSGGGGGAGRLVVLPLYGSLPLDEQRRVFAPVGPGDRKVVVATNIAETSITIDGVVFVVDCGQVKQSHYNPDARMDCLLPTWESQAAAEQRAGRAGRTQNGKCYRLFSAEQFAKLPPQTYPEMQRSNLTDIVLTILRLGVADIVSFPFVDAPSPPVLQDALTQLHLLGAIDDDMRLTPLGKAMAEVPVDCCAARMLLCAQAYGCAREAAMIAATMNAPRIFAPPPPGGGAAAGESCAHPDGDHLSHLYALWAFQQSGRSPDVCQRHGLDYRALAQADQVCAQLLAVMERRGGAANSCADPNTFSVDSVAIRRAVLNGYLTRVSFRPHLSDTYLQVKDHTAVKLGRGSVLARGAPSPHWVVFAQLDFFSADEGAVMRCVSRVEPEWLAALGSELYDPAEMADREQAVAMERARRLLPLPPPARTEAQLSADERKVPRVMTDCGFIQ